MMLRTVLSVSYVNDYEIVQLCIERTVNHTSIKNGPCVFSEMEKIPSGLSLANIVTVDIAYMTLRSLS